MIKPIITIDIKPRKPIKFGTNMGKCLRNVPKKKRRKDKIMIKTDVLQNYSIIDQ